MSLYDSSGRCASGRKLVSRAVHGHQETGRGGIRLQFLAQAKHMIVHGGLIAEVFYRILAGHGTLRSWVRLSNLGTVPVTVESVTSFLCGGLAGPHELDDLDVLWAENDWLAEGRWQRRPLRDALPDLNRRGHGADPRGRFGITSAGTWSSGTYLPMGGLVSRDAGHAWIWQIEHNGAGKLFAEEFQAAGPIGRDLNLQRVGFKEPLQRPLHGAAVFHHQNGVCGHRNRGSL